MNKILLILIILMFGFGDLFFSQPKLEFEGGSMIDWGKVKPENSPLKSKVKIYNKGKDTLRIEKIKPGCGCTNAPIDKDVIAPGDFATLDITFDVKSATGIINKNIKFTINNTENPYVMLFLKADVVRAATIEGNNYVNYGVIESGKDYVHEFKIKNNTDHDLKIISVEKLPDFCKLNINEATVIPVNGEIVLKITLNRKEPGSFSFSLRMQTDASPEPDLFISGWGAVDNRK